MRKKIQLLARQGGRNYTILQGLVTPNRRDGALLITLAATYGLRPANLNMVGLH
jgi:hypothetical protein